MKANVKSMYVSSQRERTYKGNNASVMIGSDSVKRDWVKQCIVFITIYNLEYSKILYVLVYIIM